MAVSDAFLALRVDSGKSEFIKRSRESEKTITEGKKQA